jgi:hypothetical protein
MIGGFDYFISAVFAIPVVEHYVPGRGPLLYVLHVFYKSSTQFD